MANRSFAAPRALAPAVLALAALLAGCEAPTPPPPPPSPAPVMRAPMVPPPAPVRDWRDAPLTPGDWHWAGGVAWYGADAPVLILRCTRPGAELTMQLAGYGAPAAPAALIVSITSTALTAPASGFRTNDGGAQVRFAVRDPLLDAMAFSRGRFMVAAEGLTPVIVPSWPEVSRAIEACRVPG